MFGSLLAGSSWLLSSSEAFVTAITHKHHNNPPQKEHPSCFCIEELLFPFFPACMKHKQKWICRKSLPEGTLQVA